MSLDTPNLIADVQRLCSDAVTLAERANAVLDELRLQSLEEANQLLSDDAVASDSQASHGQEGMDAFDSHHWPSDAIPLSIRTRVELLFAGLRTESDNLARANGDAAQWWQERGTSIAAALASLEHIEEEAVRDGHQLTGLIEELGGLPENIDRPNWPEDYDQVGDDDEMPLFNQRPAPVEDATPQPPAAESDPEPEAVNTEPYSIASFHAFNERRDSERLMADAWRQAYGQLREAEEAVTAELKSTYDAKTLKALAARNGVMDAKRNSKAANATAIYRAWLRSFVLGNGIQYDPMNESLEQAVDRIVAAYTDEDFTKHYAERDERQASEAKALDDPQTLGEFATFLRHRNESELTDEQFLRRDRLRADLSRETRRRDKQTVKGFDSQSLEGVELTIITGYHSKRECDLWIVQLSKKLDAETFKALNAKAKVLGLGYSSFVRDQAGFQFLSEEAANKFVALSQGDVDVSEEAEDRRIRKLGNVSERFRAMADRQDERGNGVLAADEGKLKNTARRADQAASMRARAREELANALTLRSLATRFDSGDETYLDGVRYANQIDTMRGTLYRARWAYVRAVLERDHGELSPYQRGLKQDDLEQQPFDEGMLRYVEYPWPSLYRRHLEESFRKLGNQKGMIQQVRKMQKVLASTSHNEDFVTFTKPYAIEQLMEYVSKAKAAGYDCEWFERCLVDYKRLQMAEITTESELRAALADLLPHLNPAGSDDPVTVAIDELRGKKLPGFFPTPKPLIRQLMDEAAIQPGETVFEPSAGMGDILDAVRQEHPEALVSGIERNLSLAEVLSAKGYDGVVEFGDFLEHQGQYDKVLMNPPFENGQDIDHVRHAYELVNPGGRVVAIMSRGPFFRTDAKSTAFREWLEETTHTTGELPDDAFKGVEAFRQTGVRTQILVLLKS